jgi:hypothetical protein
MKSLENITWTVMEPRQENGEASGVGTWEDHTWFIARTAEGQWATAHVHKGLVTQFPLADRGHDAWRAVRNHCTRLQHEAA